MFQAILQVLDQHANLIFLLFILIILYLLKSKFLIISHWHHTLDGSKFSTQEFYLTVEAAIKARDVPGVYTRRTTHRNRLFFSGNREYLRVVRHGIAFDICAAPNGTGLYVSWWHHEHYTNLERLVFMRIPIVNWMYRYQTLHQYDLEIMFEDVVHSCVLEAADAMTGIKGSTLSEADRAIIHNWSAMNMK